MKKFSKVCLTIAAICILLGALMVLICGFGGGFKQSYSGVNNMLRDTPFEMFIPYSAAGKESRETELAKRIDGIDTKDLQNMEVVPAQTSKDEKYQLNSAEDVIERVVLMVGIGNVEIKYSDDENYYISSSKKEGTIKKSVEDDTLAVYVEFERAKAIDDMVIYIPKDAVLDEFVLHLSAGALECDEINAEECQLRIEAGEANIKGMECESLDISVGEGSLLLDGINAEEVNAECRMGEIVVKGKIKEDGSLVADCDMGEMTIALENREDEFEYEAACSMGEIMFNGRELAGLNTSVSGSNDDADKTMKLDCDMGSINVVLASKPV